MVSPSLAAGLSVHTSAWSVKHCALAGGGCEVDQCRHVHQSVPSASEACDRSRYDGWSVVAQGADQWPQGELKNNSPQPLLTRRGRCGRRCNPPVG